MLGWLLPGITLLQSPSTCSKRVMLMMPQNMPLEARCQEDRGINAELSEIRGLRNENVYNTTVKCLVIEKMSRKL